MSVIRFILRYLQDCVEGIMIRDFFALLLFIILAALAGALYRGYF